MESDHPTESQGEALGQITRFPRATPGKVLRQAAQTWIDRGFVIVYEDDHLVELAKKDNVPGRGAVGLAVAGAAITGLAVIGATLIWLRARPWRIVSLAASPEHKTIAHVYRSPVAPESAGS
jgi:hypothetical protein